MNILAVVPARSGSKGIVDKNIKLLNGRPLLFWIISNALKSKYITRIICSTDSNDYAKIAIDCGAEVPFLRPKDISTDSSIDIEVLTHAVNALNDKEGYIPDVILRLPPTSPFLSHVSIDSAIEKLLSTKNVDSVRAITKVDKHPFKMWKFDINKTFIMPFIDASIYGYKEAFNMGRQNLPEIYIQTGGMEVLKYETLIKKGSMSGEIIMPFIIENKIEALDIDDQIDFDFAEFLFKNSLINNL
jgi:CMP-N-acetylneuraminic acid synthetase